MKDKRSFISYSAHSSDSVLIVWITRALNIRNRSTVG